VFEREAGAPDAWGEIERLLAYDGLSEGQFGSAVALDGAARIIGAKGAETYRGALYLHAPAEDPGGPLFPPTGELVDDGIVEGPGGVLLGAVGAAVAEPIPVWIHEVPAPTEPLFELAVPRGAFHNIGAVQTTIAADEGTFALALPVPEGDTAPLAAAMLVSAHRVLDGPGSV
jgi:hypothetical protein